MRILVLNAAGFYSLGSSYARAFRRLGHEVEVFDPQDELNHRLDWRCALTRRFFGGRVVARYSRRLLQKILASPAELVWVGKGLWSHPWMWREFKRRCPAVKLVCYNPDNPITTYSRGGNRSWVTDSIPAYDLYCTYNSGIVQPLKNAGARRVLHLPFAWDPELHSEATTSAGDPSPYGSDILFVGNLDAHREQWLAPMAAKARACGWNLRTYGEPHAWAACRDENLRASFAGKPLYGQELVKAIQASKVCLNILRLQNEGSHNMRTFEIPGCGGCMASQFSDEQNSFFPQGEAATYFHDRAESIARVASLLAEDAARRRLAAAAHYIAERHTFVTRATALLGALEKTD